MAYLQNQDNLYRVVQYIFSWHLVLDVNIGKEPYDEQMVSFVVDLLLAQSTEVRE